MRSRGIGLSVIVAALAAAGVSAAPGRCTAGEGEVGSVAGRLALPDGLPADSFGMIVVFLQATDGTLDFAVPKEVPTIGQADAKFTPAALLVVAGQSVEFDNNDRILHNVFSSSPPNEFDLGLFKKGEKRTVTLAQPGIVRVFCSIHANMNAVLYVVPTPLHAVADKAGRYRIEKVPPRKYRLTVWNEMLQETRREVVVTAGKETALDVAVPKGEE